MTKDRLLDAIAPHVAFDGWSETSFAAACDDLGMPRAEARIHAPRGALDLAVYQHRLGDQRMAEALAAEDLSALPYRARVARAIRLRLEAVPDREAVRRATTLFALPHHAPEGTQLIWGTADAIWTALGDTSRDVNWYSKRATLSGVYGSVLLYWLGDESEDWTDTDAFIDRRIENVMQFEKLKARVRGNRLLSTAFAPLNAVLSRVQAPTPRDDIPGGQA